MPQELPIPPAAASDAASGEMLRAWIADGGLHCILNSGIWEDPGHRGILIADVARHVANAMLESDGADPADTIARIREIFDAEFDSPTDEPTGTFGE